MHKALCIFVIAFAGFGWSKSAFADLVIDNYQTGLPLLQLGAGTATRTTVASGILGGQRSESLTVRDLGGLGFLGIVGFGPGGASVTQAANDQITGSFTYDNISSIDFTVNGYNRFRLHFSGSNSPATVPGVISVTVTSGTNSSTVFADLPATSTLPNSSYLFFSEFSGVDFANVDSVSFGFDFAGNPGGSFAIQRFNLTAIPEPSTIGLAALVVGGVCCLRRRR